MLSTLQQLGKISLAAYVTFRVSGTYCLIGRIVPYGKIPLSCYKVQLEKLLLVTSR